MTALDRLLADLREFVTTFVVFQNEHQPTAVTLWSAQTWIAQQFETWAYLHASSPEKQSGKTRLLDVLDMIVLRPWRIIQPSEAVVFRYLQQNKPTLLLDEVDTLYGPHASHHEGLRAILNAGHRRGATVPRCDERGGLHEFDVSGPKALAGIGKLPDTVADRSIPIRLKRKARHEKAARFRIREVEPGVINLRERLESWAERADLEEARPEIPQALSDRAADGWESLLAIADAAGGEWPERARAAAVALHLVPDDDDQTLGVQLLADCRDIFDSEEKLFTEYMLQQLLAFEGRPWAEMGKARKPLTAHSMARLLRPYEIHPSGTVRVGSQTAKGYLRASFEDAWSRYLAPTSPPEAPEASQRHNGEDSAAALYRFCDDVTDEEAVGEGGSADYHAIVTWKKRREDLIQDLERAKTKSNRRRRGEAAEADIATMERELADLEEKLLGSQW